MIQYCYAGNKPKRKYSEKGAEAALLDMRIRKVLRGNNKRRESRAYYHKPCHSWHITSMPLEEREDNVMGRKVQEESRMAEEKESRSGKTIQE